MKDDYGRYILAVLIVAMAFILVHTVKKCQENNIEIRWKILLIPAVIIAVNVIFLVLNT